MYYGTAFVCVTKKLFGSQAYTPNFLCMLTSAQADCIITRIIRISRTSLSQFHARLTGLKECVSQKVREER